MDVKEIEAMVPALSGGWWTDFALSWSLFAPLEIQRGRGMVIIVSR